jgi:hypothetical protein
MELGWREGGISESLEIIFLSATESCLVYVIRQRIVECLHERTQEMQAVFEVPTTAVIKVSVQSSCESKFGITYNLHFQGRKFAVQDTRMQKLARENCAKLRTTRHDIPEGGTIQRGNWPVVISHVY